MSCSTNVGCATTAACGACGACGAAPCPNTILVCAVPSSGLQSCCSPCCGGQVSYGYGKVSGISSSCGQTCCSTPSLQSGCSNVSCGGLKSSVGAPTCCQTHCDPCCPAIKSCCSKGIKKC